MAGKRSWRINERKDPSDLSSPNAVLVSVDWVVSQQDRTPALLAQLVRVVVAGGGLLVGVRARRLTVGEAVMVRARERMALILVSCILVVVEMDGERLGNCTVMK